MTIAPLGNTNFSPTPSVAIGDQAIASIESLDFWMDPAERAWHYGGGMHMQERRRGLVLEAADTVEQGAGINGTPAVSFGSDGRLKVTGYTLPEEFTMMVLVNDVAAVATFRTIFGRDGLNGLSPARFNFGIIQAGAGRRAALYSRFPSTNVSSDANLNGTDVDVLTVSVSKTNDVRFAVNTTVPEAAKTLAEAPSRIGTFGIGGVDTTNATHFDEGGQMGPLLIFNRDLTAAGYEADFATGVNYLGARGGVTIA